MSGGATFKGVLRGQEAGKSRRLKIARPPAPSPPRRRSGSSRRRQFVRCKGRCVLPEPAQRSRNLCSARTSCGSCGSETSPPVKDTARRPPLPLPYSPFRIRASENTPSTHSGEYGRLRPILSDAAAGQPSGPAPAGVCSRAAYRNNNADPTNSATKNPFRAKISTGGLHGEPNPNISAITATAA